MSEEFIKSSKLNKLYRIALGAQRRGGIVGQAFTAYTCLKCDQEKSHHNTGVPLICPVCEEGIIKKWEAEQSK